MHSKNSTNIISYLKNPRNGYYYLRHILLFYILDIHWCKIFMPKIFKNIVLDEDANLYKRYKSHTSDGISHIIKTKALVYIFIHTYTYIHSCYMYLNLGHLIVVLRPLVAWFSRLSLAFFHNLAMNTEEPFSSCHLCRRAQKCLSYALTESV